jgi:hypothetical protein
LHGFIFWSYHGENLPQKKFASLNIIKSTWYALTHQGLFNGTKDVTSPMIWEISM